MQITVTVCNVCRDPRKDVASYTITSESRTSKLDLCSTHGRPLENLLDADSESEATRPKRASRGVRSRATTLDEIEGQKN